MRGVKELRETLISTEFNTGWSVAFKYPLLPEVTSAVQIISHVFGKVSQSLHHLLQTPGLLSHLFCLFISLFISLCTTKQPNICQHLSGAPERYVSAVWPSETQLQPDTWWHTTINRRRMGLMVSEKQYYLPVQETRWQEHKGSEEGLAVITDSGLLHSDSGTGSMLSNTWAWKTKGCWVFKWSNSDKHRQRESVWAPHEWNAWLHQCHAMQASQLGMNIACVKKNDVFFLPFFHHLSKLTQGLFLPSVEKIN